MLDTSRLIYLHGSESDSNSGKARLFREWFPGMLTPDFKGTFEERMEQLYSILGNQKNWTIIGSSYGGLMGTVFTCDHPKQVRKLILLAPALLRDSASAFLDPVTGKDLAYSRKSARGLQPVSVPTTIIHGTEDNVVPLEPVREIAKELFTELQYIVVDDNHRLHKTVHELDWKSILE
ncbi:MAG: alpha/beta hydrolase [Anaerolineae bacterium]|nr:alpha/beta hydrolase [Anaerolineae bacterium]MCI0610532.1 alpha/beta hydrolase [Anaerolineae bacterium]